MLTGINISTHPEATSAELRMSLFRQTTLKISASMPQYLISTSISLELTYYNTYIAKTTMTIRNAAAIMTIMMRMTMMMAPAP